VAECRNSGGDAGRIFYIADLGWGWGWGWGLTLCVGVLDFRRSSDGVL
jgi:hypothetical protein